MSQYLFLQIISTLLLIYIIPDLYKIKFLICIKFRSTYIKEAISQISTCKVLDLPNQILGFATMMMPFPWTECDFICFDLAERYLLFMCIECDLILKRCYVNKYIHFQYCNCKLNGVKIPMPFPCTKCDLILYIYKNTILIIISQQTHKEEELFQFAKCEKYLTEKLRQLCIKCDLILKRYDNNCGNNIQCCDCVNSYSKTIILFACTKCNCMLLFK